MSKSLNQTLKELQLNVSYNILGAYAKGASRDIVTTDSSPKAIGKYICTIGNGESFDPLNIQITGERNSAPIRMGLMKTYIDYSKDKLETVKELLDMSGLSEEDKVKVLIKEAKDLSNNISKKAFSEGLEDEELKADLSIILKEGKEKFIKRTQEAQDEMNQEVTEAELPQEGQQQDDFNFDDEGEQAQGGEMNTEEEFSTDESLDFNDGFGEFDDDTVPAAEEGEGNSSLDNVGAEMDKIGGGNEESTEEDKEAKKESARIKILTRNSSIGAINDAIAKKSFGEAGLNKLLGNINSTKKHTESFIYSYKSKLTTMTPMTIKRITDELVNTEEELYNAFCESYGVAELHNKDYGKNMKSALTDVAIALVTRHILKIDK